MIDKNTLKLLKKALQIRLTEEKLLDLFSKGELNGTIHTCIGQEFASVAVIEHLSDQDVVFSNHRGHGHFISRTGNIRGLICEIMGKETGICKGVGGSQHLRSKNYYSNGIQGGLLPVALGSALYHEYESNGSIAVIFIGDGTFGEGILYESLNIASKWELPILIVVENNNYAQSTFSGQTMAGTIKGRAEAFDIKYNNSNTWDWKTLIKDAKGVIDYVRKNKKPLIFEIETYRLKAHSKGDDNRDINEIKKYEIKDPLNQIIKYEKSIAPIISEINDEINIHVDFAKNSEDCKYNPNLINNSKDIKWKSCVFKSKRIVDLIHNSLDEMLDNYNNSCFIGEDIEAPYGGAFKISKDLSIKYKGRVRNTPISEAAIVGIGTGLALKGYKCVVEIMFGDFMTLTFDQIFQHASKFCEIYGEEIEIPLIIRTPMGGKRGYGPTHSQSIEKFFLGINNLNVLALNNRISPHLIYDRLLSKIKKPTLVIENKILYTQELKISSLPGYEILMSNESFPTLKISPYKEKPQVTVVCYGGMLDDAESAIIKAFYEDEIISEIICPVLINPINIFPIEESVLSSKKLIIIEEGSKIVSFSSEICAMLCERSVVIDSTIRISNDFIIPSSFKRESELLPNVNSIYDAIKKIAYE